MPNDPGNSEIEEALRASLPLPPELVSMIYRDCQDTWIQEVASVMGELYELFVKMNCLKPEQIKYPPHTLDMNSLSRFGVTNDVISLMQQLPYIMSFNCDSEEIEDEDDFSDYYSVFLAGAGEFLDYRNPKKLRQSRDPFYMENSSYRQEREERVPYMRPWYMPLNASGGGSALMILSKRTRQLLIQSPYSRHKIDSKAKDLFDVKSNSNSNTSKKFSGLQHMKARPATEFLRDLIQSFEKLELLPGLIRNQSYEFHSRKRLYLEYGWPDDFDAWGIERAANKFQDQMEDDHDAMEACRWVEELEEEIKFWEASEKNDEEKEEALQEPFRTLKEAKSAVEKIPPEVLKRCEERKSVYGPEHPWLK